MVKTTLCLLASVCCELHAKTQLQDTAADVARRESFKFCGDYYPLTVALTCHFTNSSSKPAIDSFPYRCFKAIQRASRETVYGFCVCMFAPTGRFPCSPPLYQTGWMHTPSRLTERRSNCKQLPIGNEIAIFNFHESVYASQRTGHPFLAFKLSIHANRSIR